MFERSLYFFVVSYLVALLCVTYNTNIEKGKGSRKKNSSYRNTAFLENKNVVMITDNNILTQYKYCYHAKQQMIWLYQRKIL